MQHPILFAAFDGRNGSDMLAVSIFKGAPYFLVQESKTLLHRLWHSKMKELI